MNILTTLAISVISAVVITFCIDMVEKMLKEDRPTDWEKRDRLLLLDRPAGWEIPRVSSFLQRSGLTSNSEAV